MQPDDIGSRVPAPVLAMLARLKGAGHSAFLVGGGVRDMVRGVPPHDWDVASDATPDEVTALFAGGHGTAVAGTGLAHGTVTVVFYENGAPLPVEHTTFRTEGPYTDGRRPDSVAFTHDILTDLARRDFTVNALAWAPETGLVDPFGGLGDLAAGVLRCVGDPAARFEEDGLRVFRGVRFWACLGLTPDAPTLAAMHKEKERLAAVSAERLWAELVKTVCGAHVGPPFLACPDILGVFLPEILPLVGFAQNSPYHVYDVWEHTVRSMALAPSVPAVRLALLLHDLGKPACYTEKEGRGHFYGHPEAGAEMARKALGRLRADGETARRVEALVRYHDLPVSGDEKLMRRRLAALGPDLLAQLFRVKEADVATHAPALSAGRARDIREAEETMARILARGECFSLKTLAVKGGDLAALGLSGPAIGRGLKALLEAVVNGHCPNEKQALLACLAAMDGLLPDAAPPKKAEG